MPVRPLVLAAVVAAAVASTDSPAAQPGDKAGRPSLSLTSAYLAPPLTIGVSTYHGVEFRGELTDVGGSGTLTLDPNVCSLSEFGDPTTCTLIGPANRKVTLTRLRVDDPLGQGRRLYAVAGTDVPAKTALVVPGAAGGGYRLLIDSGKGQAIVPLTATPRAEKKKEGKE